MKKLLLFVLSAVLVLPAFGRPPVKEQTPLIYDGAAMVSDVNFGHTYTVVMDNAPADADRVHACISYPPGYSDHDGCAGICTVTDDGGNKWRSTGECPTVWSDIDTGACYDSVLSVWSRSGGVWTLLGSVPVHVTGDYCP